MKKFAGIALALALALSTAALAEGATEPVPAADPVPAVEAQAPVEEADEAENDDSAALRDAMEAYRAARQDKAVDDLEAELNGYVSAGSMTQEQADLILKNAKERIAEKNGECPNCGYRFSNGGKQRGRMGGQRGGRQRGQFPGDNRGQMSGNQMPGMNGQQMPLTPQM